MGKTTIILALAVVAFLLGQTRPVAGYALEGHNWPNGNITMNLQLSSAAYPYPTAGLQDGSASWNAVAEAALAEWNQYLQNVQFVYNTSTSITPASGDHINSVLFSSSAFGQSFGTDALAVTARYYSLSTNYTSEADVVVNTAYAWDSYRGNLQYQYNGNYLYDIRRVLDHECGHVLGLDHPDLATPPQNVTAIMNSVISNLDHIELDDVSGVMFLYGQKTVLEPVAVAASPTVGGTVSGTGNFQVGSTQQLTATPAPGYVFYQWEDTTTNPTRSITVPVQGATYTATFRPSFDVFTNTSPNGLNNPESILFANGNFMIFQGNASVTSTDGVNWTTNTPTSSAGYNAAAVAYNNAGTFVSVGAVGQAWTSTDGLNWTAHPTGLNADEFDAVTYGNGLFVAVGQSEANGVVPAPVATSPDGVTWTARTNGVDFSSHPYESIIYANGIFVAVGGYGGLENMENFDTGSEVMHSTDGINWTTTHLYPEISTFNKIVYGKGYFLANTTQGGFLTSPDAVNWTGCAPYTNDWGVGYGNGNFLALGSAIANSVDGTTFLVGTAPYQFSSDITQCAFGNNRFVAISNYAIFTSGPVAPDAVTVAPAIVSALSVSRVVNIPFGYQIAGSSSPSGFNAAGLPPGLTINQTSGFISGTPTSTGAYPVTLFATNDLGSGSANLTINIIAAPPPQTFGQWEMANNFVGNPGDTPLHDGVPNLLKFLYDLDPNAPVGASDLGALPVIGSTTANGNAYLTLTYRQNVTLSGVTVGVETSTDLLNWSPVTNPTFTAVGTDLNTGDPMMQVQVPASGSPQFIRLDVSSP